MAALEADVAPGAEREFVIDMDAIADMEVGAPKPDFYYTSETQQTRYKCDHCDRFNDIRGKYGYCALCGWRNNLQSMLASFAVLRDKLNGGQSTPSDTVRSTVSEFDACCRDMTAQLAKHIRMKPARQTELERLLFHNLDSPTVGTLKSMFDVDILRGLDAADLAFVRIMMKRRHVYEHNAGVADERYVQDSGDTTVQVGALIRETQENAHKLIGRLTRVLENFDKDFHEIFPPTPWPIDFHQKQMALRRQP